MLIIYSSIISIIAVLISIFWKKKSDSAKIFLFLAIIIPTLITTIYLASSTVYLNLKSETKGPVHWHADFEIWNCGKKVDLKDPEGFSNRVGTPIFHEHGDDRIHIEGVLLDKEEVKLHHFFEVIGGILKENYLIIPTNKGTIKLENGDLCNNVPAKLQVFVYKITNPEAKKGEWILKQEKLNEKEFVNYILSPYSQVPPGDCIIIDLDKEKQKTEKICETYKVAIQKGEIKEER